MATAAAVKRPIREVAELYVVYDADGTVVGEIVYSLRKWLRGSHCSACVITHGPKTEKPEFTRWKSTFGVPVHNIHRDEMDVSLRKAASGSLPCVMARSTLGEYELLMDDGELSGCHGRLDAFQRRLGERFRQLGLTMPRSTASPSTTAAALSLRQVPQLGLDVADVGMDANEEDDFAVPTCT